MTNRRLITKSSTKRVTAAAIADAQARNSWSNADAGDALDCCEGTIRNRLDGQDPAKQMTVHELRRSLQADGEHIANAILSDVGYRVMSVDCSSPRDALAIAGAQARCASEIIAATPLGIDRDEARALLPMVLSQLTDLYSFEAELRAILRGERPGG